MTEEEQFAHFETMGVTQVRDTAMQWPLHLQNLAYKWLKAKDDEGKRAAELAAEEAAKRTEHQEKRQKVQNLITQVLAGAALLISILSWLFPRH